MRQRPQLRTKNTNRLAKSLLHHAKVPHPRSHAPNLNFDSPNSFGEKRITLAGNLTLTTSNIKFGMHMIVFIIGDGSLRTLTFPGTWHFVGAAAPANIAASKRGMLQLWSTGTTDAEVWARWLVEP